MSFDLMSALSYDTRLNVLSFLNPSDFAQCSQTHSRWKIFIEDSEIWKELAKRIFSYGTLNVPTVKSFFKEFIPQNVKSNEKIVQKIQDFLSQVKAGQQAKFCCFLGRGSQYQTISIQILPRIKRFDADGYVRESFLDGEENHLGFDLVKNCFSLHPSDGNLLIGSSPDPVLRNNNFVFVHTVLRYDSVAVFSMDSHKIWVRLPWQLHSSNLFKKINNLIKAKIDHLESEEKYKRKRNLCAKISIIGLLLLTSLFAWQSIQNP